MNALNKNRHGFTLGFVSQTFATVRIEVAEDNVSDLDVVTAKHFNDSKVSRFNLDNEEPVFWIDQYNGTLHLVTSNAEISGRNRSG